MLMRSHEFDASDPSTARFLLICSYIFGLCARFDRMEDRVFTVKSWRKVDTSHDPVENGFLVQGCR